MYVLRVCTIMYMYERAQHARQQLGVPRSMSDSSAGDAPTIRGCDRENVEDVSLTNQQGCGGKYELLETCLAEHERDWRKCQHELQGFRACYANWQANKKKAPLAKQASKLQ